MGKAVRPKWGTEVTVGRSYEILIGRKQDPFCFKVFPENSSAGALCYKPQTGTIVAGVGTARKALYEEMNQKNFGKNVSARIVHTGQDMWVVNDLLFGVHQCICTQPKEGGVGEAVFPLQYNWTDNLMFVAQEKVGVEYGVGEQVLNHFAFGPHHVWTNTESGDIVRAWQPFNGLQVFTNLEYKVDVDKIMETPPTLCKKGGATMRIKCDDNGHYNPGAEAEVTQDDLRRARSKVPRDAYRGADHVGMSAVLNRWLNNSKAETKECKSWSVAELRDFIRLMHHLRHDGFDDIYTKTADKRSIKTDFEQNWQSLDAAQESAGQPDLVHVHRDGLCHEAVMLYMHHLTEEVREAFGRATPVPLLSEKAHSRNGHGPSVTTEATFKLYEEHVSCASCHSNPPLPGAADMITV